MLRRTLFLYTYVARFYTLALAVERHSALLVSILRLCSPFLNSFDIVGSGYADIADPAYFKTVTAIVILSDLFGTTLRAMDREQIESARQRSYIYLHVI